MLSQRVPYLPLKLLGTILLGSRPSSKAYVVSFVLIDGLEKGFSCEMSLTLPSATK